jgi:beta-N-acetylhexosaminidase
VILFGRNIENPDQLGALCARLRAALPAGAVLLVDQEGGRVARLRPPHWRAHPSAGAIGALHATDPDAGLRAAWLTGALIGLDCAGFDVICAPVLDLLVTGAHAGVVGDRSFGADPHAVASLGGAFADGVLAAGRQPVMKHAPGHGRALVDSHLSLPVVDGPIDDDLIPFQANVRLPWAMTAHIVYRAVDPDRPGTVSPSVIGSVIRGRIGFDGVLVSDDLAMSALSGPPPARAMAALAAGCDVAAYCVGDADTRAVLESAPPVTAIASRRLASGAALAAARKQTLDPDALAEERDRLLA